MLLILMDQPPVVTFYLFMHGVVVIQHSPVCLDKLLDTLSQTKVINLMSTGFLWNLGIQYK